MKDATTPPMVARFTLRPGRWYAAEFIADGFAADADCRHYSPIRVDRIEPRKGGQRTFSLEFFHANYSPGVQSKGYTLRTIERCEHFLLARRIDDDQAPVFLVLIYEVTWPWLSRHFGIRDESEREDVQRWFSDHDW